MFPRLKKSGAYSYLQIVENRRVKGEVKQRVVASLGRADLLVESGELRGVVHGLARLCENIRVLDAHTMGTVRVLAARKIGPGLVFDRLWRLLGIDRVLGTFLAERKFRFPVERAVFVTVLHRLFASGSDRAAERWREAYAIEGAECLDLHQLYRAMGWLGEPLSQDEQAGATPFAPRCVKDHIEEALFSRRQDLFSTLDVVFFDTTSIYFEGEGGPSLGQYGHSKDHRPDLKQLVVGIVIDAQGRPVCCELWPGNTTDVTTLLPIVERLRARFHIGTVCVVADRGMISRETMKQLEAAPGIEYILGVRMRKTNEVKDGVLTRGGRYHEVYPRGAHGKAPAPLKVKEVRIGHRRYIVCHNEDQAAKDAADRAAILQSLEDRLGHGDKQFIGNQGFRRYLKTSGERFQIDYDKAQDEARYDGKWVLRTSTELSATEVALKYKQLWMVEDLFRTTKSILDTRPIYHKCDETIRGHVFCSFLALVLRHELQYRIEAKGWTLEWADVLRDLDQVQELEVEVDAKSYILRTETKGTAGKTFQAVGAALPPALRDL